MGGSMKDVDVFTVRDLRERTGQLIRDAEEGRISVVTKHGRPVFVAAPFDRLMVETGARTALAVHLFAQGVLNLAQASRVADVSIEEFLSVLRDAGVAAVDYPPEELDTEMEVGI